MNSTGSCADVFVLLFLKVGKFGYETAIECVILSGYVVVKTVIAEIGRMMGHKTIKGRKGFTLAELLIVVAIVAVLVAISVPIFTSRMDRTKATVCEANRKIVLRQILLEQMEDDGFTRDGAEAILEKSDARCPAGGTFSVEWEESYVKVNCDRHGASIGGGEDTAKTVSVSFTKDYQDFVKANPKTSNDNLREAFLKKYDGKWPTLTVSGETYSIQPYYQDRGTSKQVEDRVWLFAKKESVSGWNTNYIYNPKNGQWYGATTWKGEPGGVGRVIYEDIDDLIDKIDNETHSNGNKKWAVVTDYQESK